MTEHIRVIEEDGRVIVTIDDWELFDYVDDFLTEERSIEFDYMTESQEGDRKFFSMHFADIISLERVSTAIADLSANEIDRIWRINNTA